MFPFDAILSQNDLYSCILIITAVFAWNLKAIIGRVAIGCVA